MVPKMNEPEFINHYGLSVMGGYGMQATYTSRDDV